ncbi:hypothetical protein CSKR_106419 [Clonorchis sinensis]|uniref:Uncharacterized protein n=1 Tax=Clonorchis sinensis TaxID=79923 RepID=A0A419QAQ0_CLOSI|nr:hypothetical protein CSKR_106419 [Clonorchis sinensis]
MQFTWYSSLVFVKNAKYCRTRVTNIHHEVIVTRTLLVFTVAATLCCRTNGQPIDSSGWEPFTFVKFQLTPAVIGGTGLHVEIDETLISRRKTTQAESFPSSRFLEGSAGKIKRCSLVYLDDVQPAIVLIFLVNLFYTHCSTLCNSDISAASEACKKAQPSSCTSSKCVKQNAFVLTVDLGMFLYTLVSFEAFSFFFKVHLWAV